MKGADQMIRRMTTIARGVPERVGQALVAEAEIEVTEMKKRTPVDTTPNQWYPYTIAPHPGQLRDSIHVEDPEMIGRKVSVIVATGTEAPYAVYVHENPDAFHPVGEWKFMESVLNESRGFMNARLAHRLDLNKMRT